MNKEEIILLSKVGVLKVKTAIAKQFNYIWNEDDTKGCRDERAYHELQGMIEVARILEIPSYEIYDIINKIILDDDENKVRAWKNLCRYVDEGFYKPISMVWLKHVGNIIRDTTVDKDAKKSRMQVFESVKKYTLCDDVIPLDESLKHSRKIDNCKVSDFDFDDLD